MTLMAESLLLLTDERSSIAIAILPSTRKEFSFGFYVGQKNNSGPALRLIRKSKLSVVASKPLGEFNNATQLKSGWECFFCE
jgi:hypothetical protein